MNESTAFRQTESAETKTRSANTRFPPNCQRRLLHHQEKKRDEQGFFSFSQHLAVMLRRTVHLVPAIKVDFNNTRTIVINYNDRGGDRLTIFAHPEFRLRVVIKIVKCHDVIFALYIECSSRKASYVNRKDGPVFKLSVLKQLGSSYTAWLADCIVGTIPTVYIV